MYKIEIKELQGDEITINLEMSQYAFYPTPGPKTQAGEPKYHKDDYVIALYENKKPQATSISIPLTENVRGKIYPCSGIAMVSTYPEARRKGYAKKMMFHLFDDMKKKEQVFSTLYPFKESFYEKLGYITFPQIRTTTMSVYSLTHLLKKDLNGTVTRVLLEDGFDSYLTVLKKVQKQTHGLAIKPESGLNYIKDKMKMWLAIAEIDGQVTGIMTYKIKEFFGTLQVRDFYYLNSETKYLLLQWLAKHADQVKKVEFQTKPLERPETWFVDSEAKIKTRDWVPSPMGRVVLVDKLAGMNVGEGSFSAKITDEQCEWNNNNYLFSSNNGKLAIEQTQTYDCVLSIQGLSALIYGGYNPEDFVIRGWSDASPEIQEKMLSLFTPNAPFLHAAF